MADGAAMKWLPKGRGRAAHTDANPTIVASMTLPASPEGYYAVRANVGGGKAGATSKYALAVAGSVMVNEGAASVGESVPTTSGSGFTAAITVSGLVVSVSVTAESGVYSTGTIEALDGVELAISPA